MVKKLGKYTSISTATLVSQYSQVLPNPRVPNKCLHHLSSTPRTSNIIMSLRAGDQLVLPAKMRMDVVANFTSGHIERCQEPWMLN
jgi:hypothetical protein